MWAFFYTFANFDEQIEYNIITGWYCGYTGNSVPSPNNLQRELDRKMDFVGTRVDLNVKIV